MLFKPLTLPEIEQIVDLLVAELQRRLADRGVSLELSPAARTLVAREGFDPVYGARPLKRYLQHELETRIARAIVSGEAGEGATIAVEVRDGHLTVELPAASPVEP